MSQRKFCDETHYFLLCHHDTELMVSNVGYRFVVKQHRQTKFPSEEVEGQRRCQKKGKGVRGVSNKQNRVCKNKIIKMTSLSHVHTRSMKSLISLEQVQRQTEKDCSLQISSEQILYYQIKSADTKHNDIHLFWLL